MGKLTKLRIFKSRIIEHKFWGCWELTETVLNLICLVDAWYSSNCWATGWWNVSEPWSSYWGMTHKFDLLRVPSTQILDISLISIISQILDNNQTNDWKKMIQFACKTGMNASPFQEMYQQWAVGALGSQCHRRSALRKDIELENYAEQLEQAEQAREAIRYSSNENVETNSVIQRINGTRGTETIQHNF
jgi:hypothetical protein